MTNFEKIYLMSKQPKLAITNNKDNSDKIDVTNVFYEFKKDYNMQLQYRELDRLSMELEKEINKVRKLRMEMEKYKVNFDISIESESINKIKEVLSDIDKLLI